MLGSVDTGPQIDEVVGESTEGLASSVRLVNFLQAVEQRVK